MTDPPQDDWKTTLPDDFSGREILERINTVPDLAKSYVESRRKLSSMVSLPDEGASQEERANVWRRLGAPYTAEGYDVPEGATQLAALRPTALEHGVTTAAWSALSGVIAEQLKAGQSAQEAAKSAMAEKATAWQAKLHEKYGDQTESKVAEAQTAFKQVFGDSSDVAEYLNTNGMDKHPAMVSLFLEVADAVGEGKIPPSMGGSSPMGGTKGPNALVERIQEIRNDPGYKDQRSSTRQQLGAEMDRLYKELEKLGITSVYDPKLKEA